MSNGSGGNASYKKENSPGEYMVPDTRLRIISEGFKPDIEFTEDPSLISEDFTTEKTISFKGASGTFEALAHPDSVHFMWKAVLGKELPISKGVVGRVVISYTGPKLFHQIRVHNGIITSETSNDGNTWTPDNEFNENGVLNCSGISLKVIQKTIDGYDSYSALPLGNTSITGNTLNNTPDPIITRQNGKHVGVGILEAVTDLAFKHTIIPADPTQHLPTYSFLINRVIGVNKSIAYVGMKAQSLTINCTGGDDVKQSLSFLGRREETNKLDVNLPYPTPQTYKGAKTEFIVIDETGNMTYFYRTTDSAITVNRSLTDKKYMGSYHRQDIGREKGTIELTFTADNNPESYQYRESYEKGTPVEVIQFSSSVSQVAPGVDYSQLVRIPRVKLDEYFSPLSGPGLMTIAAKGTAEKPQNNIYPKHIYVETTDSESVEY